MAKKLTLEGLEARVAALEEKVAALGNDESEASEDAVSLPTAKEIAKLSDKGQITKLAAQLGIETEGVKVAALKALLVTAANIVAGETDDIDDEDLNALAEACGITPSKKAKTLAALAKYLEAASESEEEESEDESEDEDEDESEDEEEEEESEDEEEEESEDDEEEDEDEDEDEEKPKKKGKKAAEEDEDEDSEDEDEDSEEEEESEDDEEEEESEDDEDEDEDAPKLTDKHVALFNKAAKKAGAKPVKDVKALAKLLVDAEGESHPWGEPYSKDGEAWCCGLPVADLKVVNGKGKKVSGGVCVVTGKKFFQNDEGELEQGE